MLKRLEIVGFKSFVRKTVLDFSSATTAVVGPNGSGKSNLAEAFRFALGEQSMKSMRGKRSEDLIFNGSHTVPRSNRAAVTIVFDNARREFKIDYDEVSIERAILRDGSSEYSINGSKVRLRDIEELLAGANIGETGHHIISQGEADRILLANARERRTMLEDALGLKVYEFKKQEAQKKLEKTEVNIQQVNSLRRELAPHLRFLERQVEKLERAEGMRQELIKLAGAYFATEDAYLAQEKVRVAGEKGSAQERLASVSAELAAIEERATTDAEGTKRLELSRKAEQQVERLASERSALARDLGRVEGALHAAKERSKKVGSDPYAKVSREDLITLAEEAERQVKQTHTPEAVLGALKSLHAIIKAFVDRFVAPSDDLLNEEERSVYTLEEEHKTLLERDAKLDKELEEARLALGRAREALTAYDETGRELRRHILEYAQNKAREEAEVVRLEARERELFALALQLDTDKAEVVALVGTAAVSYEAVAALLTEERTVQEARKHSVERLKIRLEESGGGGEDIRTEHKEVSEREAFLARELEDLDRSAKSLANLIDDLNTELAKHFADGLAKVNQSFNEYFALMFGGGSARLVMEAIEVEDENEEQEEGEEDEEETIEKKKLGIEINVSLPKKKVRSLMQLSGGERALTSIALIFAMSQVNPPPFLILDETDAALDEANSRRYGDMIENLAQKSQLIVITHNRETMSRAGILYGVTMGNDGISKLLSVKFDEAVSVAK
ncbi:MAG: AAA family ATPase [Candidatus Paceibacterota bacterium]